MQNINLPSNMENLSVSSLLPYANNARVHSKKNVKKLVESIKEFGWTQPVLITDGGEIIAGHGRVLAAQEIGLESVPCIRLSNLSEEQIRAYRIADNQLALDSDWDEELLTRELGDLSALDYSLSLMGFDAGDLRKYLAADERRRSDVLTEEDDDVETSDIIVARRGQMWELGDHRVACGDCTDPMIVNSLLAGKHINLMVTDPPYGVNYEPAWRIRLGPSSRSNIPVEGDNCADWRGALAYFRGNIMYVWHGGINGNVVQDGIMSLGFDLRAQIIWVKPGLLISRGNYNWQHEPCFYAVRKGQKADWLGGPGVSSVWEVKTLNRGSGDDGEKILGHATQKPVELMRRPILYHTREGESVYDPFLGSGTTLIAAESTGRVCIGCELMPNFVDMIIRRWQSYTGKDAMCEGRTFGEWELKARELDEQAV